MQELEQRSGGAWRPSSGSIYPALQQLEDEGMVEQESTAGGRTFQLTKRGRAYFDEHKAELSAPWDAVSEAAGGDGDERFALMSLVRQVGAASAQVLHAGTPAQLAEAKRLLQEVRRGLYRLLAEDEPEDGKK